MEGKNEIIEKINSIYKKIMTEVNKIIIGQDEIAKFCIVALMSKGHVLVEGVPGTAKTLLMRTLAKTLGFSFNRIQFTPDLMPADILGTNIPNPQKTDFVLIKGPTFTQFLLADEINRTPPKTQSALLQAMQEFEITIDGVNYHLGETFFVAATQNPIEQEGTYPLPEAQLDRFLLKLVVKYPNVNSEIEMVQKHHQGNIASNIISENIQPVTNVQQICTIQNFIQQILVSDNVIRYIVELVRQTRENPWILCGASPRATLMFTKAARTLAVLEGRDYVIPDDVKRLYECTIGHRIVLTPTAQIEGYTISKVLQDIVEKVAVPR